MSDQAPVTDDDRKAHEWAHANKGRANDSVARAIFRHVPAPPATLADELRTASWGDIPALADRVEAVVQERDEARAEVERLTSGRTVRESRTVALPDPADVPSEEMWLIRTKKDQLMAGVRNPNGDWSVLAHNGFARECELDDEDVTLVSRLVPDVRRVIDRPEDLDALPAQSIVLDVGGDAWQKDFEGDFQTVGSWRSSDVLIDTYGPVTVIHEPEVTA
ncbi:MAG: hypothetical protein ACTH2Y_09215 [Corynebacterium sp.]|uniref:hypothetical protein n=1 Tax=Corynebacterium sp. TaxID=1720 RepID=UPI003F920351